MSENPAEEPAFADSGSEGNEKRTCGQILKASAMIGGSSLVNIAAGAIRTKAMAVMLGPAGFGLMGLYSAIADLAKSIATMGINSSGVRQIAAAVGCGETEQVARTAAVLRRISFLLGVFGAGLLIALAGQLSVLTFASEDKRSAIALLSLAVFFACVSGGQSALIHGMRRISDLAKMGIYGSVYGTAISIPMVYFFGEQGVVPSLVAIAAIGTVASWWYSRKVALPRPAINLALLGHEAGALLKLGFAFMASALMMTGAAYAIRLLLLRTAGAEAAGLYQASWTLGGLYIGFILEALGTDFYPRLTGIAGDNAACNRMVNQQAQISLLLAGPGVLATLTFAPLAISLFYSAEFEGAVEMLRWICLGMALRVVSWPVGFVILAKGAHTTFFWVETAWTVAYLALAWGCVVAFGAMGAGVAFFASYVFHVFLITTVVRRLSGFRWQPANLRIVWGFLGVIVLTFLGLELLPGWLGTSLGTLAVLGTAACSIRTLARLVSLDRLPRPLRNWLRLAGLLPRQEAPPLPERL